MLQGDPLALRPAVSERGFWQGAPRPAGPQESLECGRRPLGPPELLGGEQGECLLRPEPVGSAVRVVAPRAAALLRGWGGPCREPEIGFVHTSQIRADWAGTGAICDPGACLLPVGAPASLSSAGI